MIYVVAFCTIVGLKSQKYIPGRSPNRVQMYLNIFQWRVQGGGGAQIKGALPPPYFRQILLKSPLNWLKFSKKSWEQAPKTLGTPFFHILDPPPYLLFDIYITVLTDSRI